MKVEIRTKLKTVQKPPEYAVAPWLKRNTPRFELVSPFVVMVGGEPILVPSGYIFDGSTVPRFLWWVYPPSHYYSWEAACVHDYCYSHLYRRISKKKSDKIFKAIMRKRGANPIISHIFYLAVRLFGRGKYN